MKHFQFTGVWTCQDWTTPAYVSVNDAGLITHLSSQPPAAAIAIEHIHGLVLPGFQNAHSHAFQFAMAGLAEQHAPNTADDFWSWREAMYQCALRFSPDEMEEVATQAYTEMLRNGYTHVAEFHYLHHDPTGKPYDNLAEMGERLVAAAKNAGIKITLIPVFYQQGGFGKDPQPRQRRFISATVDEYFQLLDDSAHAISYYEHASLGFSVHSLRAVKPEDIIKTFQHGPKSIPFHLHAAEQLQEVSDCVDFLKQRPVEWLLNNLPLDSRFHLVHGTHLNDEEVKRLAHSGAHVVLCPGTEGNLGDGIFRLREFAAAGGVWSIGTDSHISLNPLEDLRWLDYAQRLTTHQRNTFPDGAMTLINTTQQAGKKAMGINSVGLRVGEPLDAVVYNSRATRLQQVQPQQWLPTIVYTMDASQRVGTLVNGVWVNKINI